jgi:hypothetical protein
MRMITGIAVLSTLMASSALAQTGNGAPKGAHYTLNIIGVENPRKPTSLIRIATRSSSLSGQKVLEWRPRSIWAPARISWCVMGTDSTRPTIARERWSVPLMGPSSDCRATQT